MTKLPPTNYLIKNYQNGRLININKDLTTKTDGLNILGQVEVILMIGIQMKAIIMGYLNM
jgi:hypothetical protein